MVRVSGAVRLVTGRVSDVVSVGVRAREVRTDGRDVVVDFSDTVKITGGQLSFECLPGPAVLVVAEAVSSQVAVPLLVPSRDASLAECIDAAKQADGQSLASLERLVFEARDAAAGVRADADRAANSASAAGQSESRAKTAETNAATSARNAKTSAGNASDHASKAAQSEIAAGTSAESAKRDADRVATIAGSTRWVGTKVEVNGKLSPDLMPVLTISPQGTWVVNGKDTGKLARGADGKMTFEELTPAQRESLKVKGDKGDKGDKGEPGEPGAPGTTTWSGITGKPTTFTPETHSHEVGDIANLFVRFGGGSGVAAPTEVGAFSVAVGPNASAVWKQAVALGVNASANGNSAVALGDNTSAARSAVALGVNASAQGSWSVALGATARASMDFAHALTAFSKATKNRHTVIGIDATDENIPTNVSGTVVVGKPGVPVYLAGVDIITELNALKARVEKLEKR